MSRTKKIAILAIIAMVLTMLPAQLFAGVADDRLYGQGRIETALEICDAFGSSADEVVLAAADQANLVDALAAASLAGAKNAPILLTWKDSLVPSVKAKIQDLGASKVYVIGAVSDAVKAEVDAMSGVQAVAVKGKNRWETTKAINALVDNPAGSFVVGYNALPDALSVASFAYANRYEIILADPNGNVPAGQTVRGAVKYVIGGPTLVKDIDGATRIYGANRYETNAKVLDKLGYSFDTVYVANGQNGHLVDSLVIAALANGNAVALTDGNSVEANDVIVAKQNASTKVVAVGGPTVVPDTVKSSVGKTTPVVSSSYRVTASNQPASGSVYTGSGQNEVFKFQLSAGSEDLTLSSVIVKEYSTADGGTRDVKKVYLVDASDNTVLCSGTFNESKVRLNKQVVIPAGQTKEFKICVDIQVDAQSTGVLKVGIDSASDIVASHEVSGSFPLIGNDFTILSASVGVLTVQNGNTAGSTLKIGDENKELGSFKIKADDTEGLKVTKVVLNANGVDADDFDNLYLWKKTGSEKINVKGVISGDNVIFNLASAPIELDKNQSDTIYLKGDVVGGLNNTGEFRIKNAYDIQAVGRTTGANVLVDCPSGTPHSLLTSGQLSIAAGDIILTKSTRTPTGTIVASSSDAGTIRIYDFKSPGEDVIINNLTIALTAAGSVAADTVFDSFYLYDGEDNEIAGPVKAPSETVDITATPTPDVAFLTFEDVNWYIPANVEKEFQIRATYAGSNDAVDVWIQDVDLTLQTSDDNQHISCVNSLVGKAFVNGGKLDVSVSATTPDINLDTGYKAVGANDVVIAKYLFKAVDDSVELRNLSFDFVPVAPETLKATEVISYVGAYVNDEQYGTRLASPGESFTIDLTSKPVLVPKNETVEVVIKANLDGTKDDQFKLQLKNVSAISKSTSENVDNIIGTLPMQAGVIELEEPTLAIAQPDFGQVEDDTVTDSEEIELVKVKVKETSKCEDVKLTRLSVQFASAGADAVIKNIKVYDGDKLIGTYPSVTIPANTSVTKSIEITEETIIPADGSRTLTVKGTIDDDGTPSGAVITVSAYAGSDYKTKGKGATSGVEVIAGNALVSAEPLTRANAKVTVEVAEDSPAGNYALTSRCTLLKFTIKAEGGKAVIPADATGKLFSVVAIGTALTESDSPPPGTFDAFNATDELGIYRNDDGKPFAYTGTDADDDVAPVAINALYDGPSTFIYDADSDGDKDIVIGKNETITFYVKYQSSAGWAPGDDKTISISVEDLVIEDDAGTVIFDNTSGGGDDPIAGNALKF